MHDGAVVVWDVPRVDPFTAKPKEVSFVTSRRINQQRLFIVVAVVV